MTARYPFYAVPPSTRAGTTTEQVKSVHGRTIFRRCVYTIVLVRMLGHFIRPAHISTTNAHASYSGPSFLCDIYTYSGECMIYNMLVLIVL